MEYAARAGTAPAQPSGDSAGDAAAALQASQPAEMREFAGLQAWQTAHSHPAVFSEADAQGLLVKKAESFEPQSPSGRGLPVPQNAKQAEAQARLEQAKNMARREAGREAAMATALSAPQRQVQASTEPVMANAHTVTLTDEERVQMAMQKAVT